jgi:CRP-like cAMP-binding protein
MSTLTKTKRFDSQPGKAIPLSSTDIFRNIPAGALREIENQILEKKYAKGEHIFMEDDPASFVWFVKEGHVKAGQNLLDGQSQTLSLLGPGKMFGFLSFEGGVYGVYSMAETDATVVSVPIGLFLALLGKHPGLSKDVLLQLSQRLHQSKDRQGFAHEFVEKRLLHVLLELSGEYGATIPLTRKEIAEMAGTAVETCIRMLGGLEGRGLVTRAYGMIRINNLEDLKARIEEL